MPAHADAPRTAATLALAALLCGACGGVWTPRSITLPDSRLRPASHIDAITDDAVAVATISAILDRDFGVGPLPVTLHYYPDSRAFEAELRTFGYDAVFARKFARTMRAAGGHRRVLLNEAALARLSRRMRVRVLAHELAHSLEYELGAGVRGTSDQWIREGFAEWLASHVVDRLRGRSMGDVRWQRLLEFRRSNVAQAPQLAEMSSAPAWVALTARRGIVPYAQAFLAVDALVERRGVGAVLEYFRLFTRSSDRAANFRTAFGVDLPAFAASVEQRLRIRRANAAASR